MKIAIYSPYLDTFGGGEKYMMTIAEIASLVNSVDVFLDNNLQKIGVDCLKNTLSKRFNLNLNKVNFIKAAIGKNSSWFSRTLFLKRYDVLFYLTDGSIFYPTAKKNILHIQAPIIGQPAKNNWGKFKLKGWDLIIYNSVFTRDFSKKYWPLKSEVVYPPVDTQNIKPLGKKKIILSVGRFFGYLKNKKQTDLIMAFKNLYKNSQAKGWSLYFVGSAGEGDKEYLFQLKSLIGQLPIKLYPNLEYDELIKLYGQACIYWHAAGLGEADPAKMEHFGISTVEAMAGGCVPVVIGKGGQTEIVKHGESGFLWNTIKQLEGYTIKLIEDVKLREALAQNSVERAKNFDKKAFENKITQILNSK